MSKFDKKTKVLITLEGGGYLWEARRLIDGLGDRVEYAYVTSNNCLVPPQFAGSEVYRLRAFSSKARPHWWQVLPRLLVATVQCCVAVLNARPDAVVGVASPTSVPLAIAVRLLGKKFIFVESITRVGHPSRTGRILERLGLVDRFYVQWPEALELYKSAIYKGDVI